MKAGTTSPPIQLTPLSPTVNYHTFSQEDNASADKDYSKKG